MKNTYVDFICGILKQVKVGIPIYTKQIALQIAGEYEITEPAAAAATAVAMKRIMDAQSLPDLRCYQKGIYYRTVCTPFGESAINKERLIADRYLLPDQGYETGLTVLHQMGLTSQLPRQRTLATNHAKNCVRSDEKLGVFIRPPKTPVNAENKQYLQTLDVLNMLKRAPVDAEDPYEVIAVHIKAQGLKYDKLLALADQCYNQNTVIQLAHTASKGGGL